MNSPKTIQLSLILTFAASATLLLSTWAETGNTGLLPASPKAAKPAIGDTINELAILESESDLENGTDGKAVETDIDLEEGTDPATLTGPLSEYVYGNGKTARTVRVVESEETGHASLYVGKREVIRFRSTLEDKTPLDRALETLNGLREFLEAGGKPQDIWPKTIDLQAPETESVGVEPEAAVSLTTEAGVAGAAETLEAETASKSIMMIYAGDLPIAVVDEETAAIAELPAARLAALWAAQTRRAFEVGDDDILGNFQPTGKVQKGLASWYGPGFHGKRAASGKRFNMYEMTAAHRTLPFGTLVRVFNQWSKKSCVVKITDRGPYSHGRIIDLSKAAAHVIGLDRSGVAQVTLEVLEPAPDVVTSHTNN